jgi:excisionase family DNA binding protein
MPRKAKQSTAPALDTESRLLRVHAAAAYLSCTPWFMRSLGWSRQVPFLKLGNRILFDRSDLDAFVEKQKAA